MNGELRRWTILVRDLHRVSRDRRYLVLDYNMRSAMAQAILEYIDDSGHARRSTEPLPEFYKRYEAELVRD